jgi:hypothetical protein
VVKLLLNEDADVNAQGGYCGNVLQAASYDAEILFSLDVERSKACKAYMTCTIPLLG